MSISVIIPSYNNPDGMEEAIHSLLRNCEDKKNLEIIIRIDNDDPQRKIYEDIYNLQSFAFSLIISDLSERGYQNLHLFVNELASHTKNDWIMIMTDDAIMKTKGWDTIISEYDNQKYTVLNPCGQGMNLFPIIKRDLYNLLGHISLNAHYDTFISTIAHENRKQIRINNIQIDHNDILKDHSETSNHYYSEEIQKLLKEDIDKLNKCVINSI